MLTDEKLLEFMQEGYIPGPSENEESFLSRINKTEGLYLEGTKFFEREQKKLPFSLDIKMKKYEWSWARLRLFKLFGFFSEKLPIYHNNFSLTLFQGGATWEVFFDKIKIPLIQLRKNFIKGSYLGIYSLDEMLAHESVHAARIAFDEPIFEEFFAYMTSKSFFRRFLGPVFRDTKEVLIFLFLLLGTFVFQVLSFYSSFFLSFFFISFLAVFVWMFLGFFRLFKNRFVLQKTLKKMASFFEDKKKAMSLVFCLTDKEIFSFSRISIEKIKNYLKKESQKTLRGRLLLLLINRGV